MTAARDTSRKQIALVEDDPDIAYSIKFNLEKSGAWEVSSFDSGQKALDTLEAGGFDLVVLDLNLPDLDGLTLCRELREIEATRHVPILMLTARVSERDRVRGLDAGADDYVAKPFSMPELVARVAAHLRRSERDRPSPGDRYEDRRLSVDRASHEIRIDGHEIHLTKKELDLLWLLLSSRPRVLSRDTILARAWDWRSDVDTRTIDVHVRALRRKLGEGWIETVVGVGYRFRENGEHRDDASSD